MLRCFYNFVRPHSRLTIGKRKRTPAMQAGIFGKVLSFREIFNWVPPRAREPYTIDFRMVPATVRGGA